VAHTLHPVAGQGFNLALRDAMALAANVRQSLRDGQRVGNVTRLQAWWQQVQQDQARTIGFSDGMTRLFSNPNTGLSLLRKGGMAGLELLPPLKRLFMQQALGYHAPSVRL
jgi:2-octaprenyl-6-methoxyphenol hydroxylase